jgi:elongator complex protein 3
MSYIPPIDITKHRQILIPLLIHLNQLTKPTESDVKRAVNKYPKPDGYFRKTDIFEAFKLLSGQEGVIPPSPELKQILKVKPVRTLSGVTPVTVLTKPYPCPGECIFCPSDVRMPKSYLSMEPGAQRAANNHFDPYLQIINRLSAFKAMGHVYDKTELIILGGTWSVYPLPYRIWFIKRLFEALNDFGDNLDQSASIQAAVSLKLPDLKPGAGQTLVDNHQYANYNQAVTAIYGTSANTVEVAVWEELEKEQRRNEQSLVRCVGLVLETRPDYVTATESINLRRLGATKIQLGIQSLDDQVLKLNKRGHTASQSAKAIQLLRSLGFKLHLHWMPNLYGSTPSRDQQGYRELFENPVYCPDEIKIYPCSLIEGTELMERHHSGEWQPYSHEELLDVVGDALQQTPRYCRVTRVVRDIPSGDIVTGNKYTNFRQMAEAHLKKRGLAINDIRSREIRNQVFEPSELVVKDTGYKTSTGDEHFIEYITPQDQIAAFLRLSLPINHNKQAILPELAGSALIREVHVYGQAIMVGSKKQAAAQHGGLGKKLIARALSIANQSGYNQVSVISAIGTREYYRKIGFTDGELYQHYPL